MFEKFFDKKIKSESARFLETPFDLRAGDIVTFKPKSFLPDDLSARDFTVEKVTTYQYERGNIKELVIKGGGEGVFYMSIDPNDGDPQLCVSRKLSKSDVTSIFDGERFALLFDEFVDLDPISMPEEYIGWIAERYLQTVKEEVGFYYDKECNPNEHTPGGEEFRLYEFEGDPDHFSMSIEVYGDGETDVLLEVSGGFEIIDQMWPA